MPKCNQLSEWWFNSFQHKTASSLNVKKGDAMKPGDDLVSAAAITDSPEQQEGGELIKR